MRTWLIFCLFCANYVGCEMEFPPLPQGKPYSLESGEDSWSLNGLTSIANDIALTLRNQAPYEIIGNTLSNAFGKGGKSPEISEVIDYEVPLIVLASLSLIAALVIPIIGLVFCCCRCRGKCGGIIYDDELKQHPAKERIAYSAGILLCASLLIISGGFILASSIHMNDSIPHARTVWNDSFSDIKIYAGNLLQEINHILLQEAVPTIDILFDAVIAMGRDIVVPIIQSPVFQELYSAVKDVDQAVKQTAQLFGEIADAKSSLISKSSHIQNELISIQKALEAIHTECIGSGGSSLCDEIPFGKDVETEADFNKVPNVTDSQNKIEDVAKSGLGDDVAKGNQSLQDMAERVQNLTTNLTNEFQNFTSKIKDMPVDVVQPFRDNINKYIADTLFPIRDDVDEKYLGPDGLLSKYDNYRHIAFVLIGVLSLLDGLLLIIAVVMGLCGSLSYDTPSSRSNLSHWAGRLMLGAAGLFFFSAFLFNLLTGITFMLGANIAVVCDGIPDYKLLEKTIDDPKFMGGEYLLSEMILNNGNIPLTVSGVLSECSKNQAPWDVLKMDHVFNLSVVLNYKDRIPELDAVFATLNETVKDTEVIPEKTKKSVNDSLNAGVSDINFTQYHEQVNKPIVTVSLPSFASNVSKAANTTKSQASVSNKLANEANKLDNLDKTYVKPAEKQAKDLGKLASDLQQSGQAILSSGERVVKSIEEVATFLQDDALSIAAKGVTMHWDNVFGNVDYLLDYVIRQVRFDVGKCKVLSNIYHGFTGSVCSEYAAGMNASWVASGLSSLVLLVSIILCVKASKHFLRAKKTGVFNKLGISADFPSELPWLDGLGIKDNYVNLVDVKSLGEI
ncbi:unnamed protein product [Pocillopora meandrina]|uniref:Uncharacterized protein n=1 Tax=Pocillopora meandrina TaxID=46732 RepID=A0AAU9VPJ3_9CNID|nr:unnamed protein product [Pocillopora meandrina]